MKPIVKAGVEERKKSEILLECWNKGSETNKKRLDRYRLIVETFAYNCMEELEKDLRITAQKEREEIFKDIEKLICFDGSCSLINETDYWQLKQKRIDVEK